MKKYGNVVPVHSTEAHNRSTVSVRFVSQWRLTPAKKKEKIRTGKKAPVLVLTIRRE
jgi:hypothetical protein